MNLKNVSKAVKKKDNKRIMTENSDFSQRTDGGNIFLDSSQQYIDSGMIKNTINFSQIDRKGKAKQRQFQNDQEKNQKQKQVQKEDDVSLSLLETFRFYSGQIRKQVKYPYCRIVAINNCNKEENSQNRKILRQKFERMDKQFSSSEQYYKTNSIKVNFSMPLLYLLYDFLTSNWEWYLYLIITIINSLVQKHIFFNNAQYVGQPIILITITIFYIVINLASQYLSIRKRTAVIENEQQYKIYTHDGIQQEWKMVKASQIKPGFIFKVQIGNKIPTDSLLLYSTDSLLLHAKKSMILIEQTQENNHGKTCRSLKETIIRKEQIKLPISGILEYKVEGDQNSLHEWIKGKLELQEPQKVTYQVGHNNILRSNSINVSFNQCQLICMALQGGSDSFNLKQAGYPSLWKNHQNIIQNKTIKSIKKLRFYFIIVTMVCYFILCVIGVLVGYVSQIYIKDHPYLSNSNNILKILFYHATNFIIFVPILLNPSLLIYQIFMTKITQINLQKRQIQLLKPQNHNKNLNSKPNQHQQNNIFLPTSKLTFKDKSIIPYLQYPHTLVLGTQLFQQNKYQQLKLIHIRDFQYNFPSSQSSSQQSYTNQQINLIKSFLSVSLLTYTNKSQQKQNRLFQSVKKYAKQQFSLLLYQTKQFFTVTGPLQDVFSQGKLQLIPYFTIYASKQYPYSLNFYQIPDEKKKQDQQARVLCILRGDPQTIIMKVYNKKVKMLIQSERLHEQKGFQIQLIGKFSCFYHEAKQLKKLFEKSFIQRQKFYQELETYLAKVQPMGLLAFQNDFSHQKNNYLNQFMDMKKRNESQNLESMKQNQLTNCPNMILINPRPKFLFHPEQESVNRIKFMLGNKNFFNFGQGQIGQKIVYDPISVDEMIQKLKKQKVIVLNGWSQQNISIMLSLLRTRLMLMAVIEKQNEIYLTKLCQYSTSIHPTNNTYNYTDIIIKKKQNVPKTITLLSLIQILNYDSQILNQGFKFILLTHIIKFICYFLVESINIAFTLGTGISLLRLPLYLKTQIIIFLDIFYHLNWNDTMQFRKDNIDSSWWYHIIKSLCYCLVGCLIIIYSSVRPDNETSSVFCILHVHLLVTHLLIFSKIFYSESINLYKMIVIGVQIAIYYIGMSILGEVSLYEFNGVISHMFNHKLYLVAIVCIWIFLSFEFIFYAIYSSFLNIKGIKIDNKYQQVKRVNKDTNLQLIDLSQN